MRHLKRSGVQPGLDQGAGCEPDGRPSQAIDLRARGARGVVSAAMWFLLGPRALASALGLLRGPQRVVPTPPEDWRRARIDVVICARNQQRCIVHCMAALAAQTVRPRRLLLVDDGGAARDHTAQLAREFAQANGLNLNIIVRRWSLGRGATLRKQARSFDGDVLFALDGDTVLDSPDYIERCVRELYQGAGIASACGQLRTLGRAHRQAIAATGAFRAWLAGDHWEDPHGRQPRHERVMRWMGDAYRETLALYEQRLINRGQMDRTGGITRPVGPVAYRRRYLKDLFDRWEPVRGDDLTGDEDQFIGMALAHEGYRNVQLPDVTARRCGEGLLRLPAAAHRESVAFLEGARAFDALLRTPLTRLHNATHRGPHAELDTGHEQRRIVEAYRQPFGERLTRLCGRPIGTVLHLTALERIGLPALVVGAVALGHGTTLLAVLGVEALIVAGLLAWLSPGSRVSAAARGLLTAPLRYGLMLAEWAALLRFAARRVRGGLRPARA